MIITIDGPVASGKSTVARMLAQDLNFYYVASGMWYRALAYLLVQDGFNLESLYNPDIEKVDIFFKDIDYTYNDHVKECIWYHQKNLTPFLKTKEIDQASSILSLNAHVRESLLKKLRSFAQCHNIVIDGRDCGSVIFPDAEVKIYLTADICVRAQRWLLDQQNKGLKLDIDEAMHQVALRDKRDSEREIAPLKIPEKAHIVDTSKLDNVQVKEVIKKFLI